MANEPRAVDFTTIMLADKERRLVLDMAALRRAELRLRAVLGRDLSIWNTLRAFLNAALVGEAGLTELTTLIAEGLRHEEPTITEDAVLAMLTPRTIASSVLAIVTAVNVNFPDVTPREGAAAASPLPGSISGPPAPATSA
jgi:hypothetical protein